MHHRSRQVFESNSFEQLCINYANEKLQQHFIVHNFQTEQELYKSEGIQWKAIPYSDNRDCLALLQDKGSGLLDLLDDNCRGPKPSDAGYLERVYSTHLGKSKRLAQPRPGKGSGFAYTAKEAFVVDHFAGQVCYAVAGFIDKNTDALTVDCELSLAGSSHPLVNACFSLTAPPPETPKKSSGRLGGSAGLVAGAGNGGGRGKSGGKKKTVSSGYMMQMASLHDDLSACAPHFIRAIKTNRASKPNAFDGSYVLAQLRCSGMMEALELMQVCRMLLCRSPCPEREMQIVDRCAENGWQRWSLAHL